MRDDLDVRTSTRLSELSTNEAAEALNRCFENYVVPFHLSAAMFAQRFGAEGLDPLASRLVGPAAEPLAIVLVTRRGAWSRVGAFAVAPEARGRGVGRKLFQLVLEEAVARGDRGILLEVIEGNRPAIQLYESMGLSVQRRLIGFRRGERGAAHYRGEPLESCAVLTASRQIALDGATRDLPWPLRPETMAGLTGEAAAFSLSGEGFAIVQNACSAKPQLTCLFVAPQARGRGLGSRLLDRLTSRYDREWIVPPYVPERQLDCFMANAGWRLHETSQLEMKLVF